MAQLVKNPLAMPETWVRSLGWEDPLEKGKATHASILAWRNSWTVWFMGLQRVGHYWAAFTFIQRRRWKRRIRERWYYKKNQSYLRFTGAGRCSIKVDFWRVYRKKLMNLHCSLHCIWEWTAYWFKYLEEEGDVRTELMPSGLDILRHSVVLSPPRPGLFYLNSSDILAV